VVRGEEQLVVGVVEEEAGKVRIRRDTVSEPYAHPVERQLEEADVERRAANEGDSGQIETLADGSVSIPVFEEELVVEKRLVVRERIIVRKRTVTEERVIEAELRRQRVEIETEDGVTEVVAGDDGRP
jgi:uncharacterized protein (TIGR02271 family)